MCFILRRCSGSAGGCPEEGPGQLITAAFDSLKTLCTKPRLWGNQHSAKNINDFLTCNSLLEEGTAFSGEEYAFANENLLQEFDQRFADFKAHCDTFQLYADPFSADVENVPSFLHLFTCSATVSKSYI